MQGNDYYVAKTFHGLEAVLSEELRQLGATDIRRGKRMVTFRGDQVMLYKANLHLRTAVRILVPVTTFRARNENELYDGIRQIRWRQYMRVHDTFAIDAVVNSHLFRHTQYVALKSKDAIVDQFRERSGERPSVDVRRPRIRIHIFIQQDEVTVYRDSSGDSLHKRGYRNTRHKAPISETLAAGMILLSGWKGDTPFMDPMCGSGTIAMEAALIARNQAPGLGRKFGFETWPDLNRLAWKEVIAEAEAAFQPVTVPILASDQDRQSVREAEDTVRQAGLHNMIQVEEKSWTQLLPPAEPGTLIMNPPYGERLQDDDLFDLYRSFGDRLKKHFPGWKAYIISSNFDALKKIGLRADQKFDLYNGKLACKYLGYEMFRGSLEDQTA